MNNSRQEYPALLATLEPREAVNLLNDRIEVISRTNSDIADWLSERRKVEETYVQGLRRLAKRPQRDGGASLGIFQLPWQRVVESTESLAQSHESLAQKIEIDAETPLRQFASKNREMQNISTIQGNLASIAREVNSAQKKADRLKDKTGRLSSARAANATSSADDASQQWETQAPYVFEQLQALDETRVNHLKDVLTQFQTHEVDSIEQNRKPAELCLNALLNIEIADEIKIFTTRISTEPRQAPLARRRSSASNSMGRLNSAGGESIPAMPPPPRMTSDRIQEAPSFVSENGGGGLSAGIKETPKKKPGLKSRLGTVIGRRKNTAPPPVPGAENPKKDKNRSSLMPFRIGDSSRSRHGNAGAAMMGYKIRSPAASMERAQPTDSYIQSHDANRQLSVQAHTEGQQQQISISSAAVNGITAIDTHPEATRTNASLHQTPIPNNLFTPPTQPLHELSVTPPSPVPQIDVINRAQQEAAATNAENEEAVRRLKIRDQPIQEDEIEAQKAMTNITNQLRLQAQTSGVNRLAGSMRGRRDVRNTVYVPNPEPPLADEPSAVLNTAPAVAPGVAEAGLAGAGSLRVGGASYPDPTTASPIKAPAMLPEERTMSDTTSVYSAQSLGTLIHHPEMHEPGLNASIVETVSTWFSEGIVKKSFVVGEIALAYNPTQSGAVMETIRLDNFPVLEKIAPNPNFVSSAVSEKGKEKATSEEKVGEYSVSVSGLKRPTPVVAFKYQLHMDPVDLSASSPILLTPAWQIQDAQASVIVLYTLNPAFFLSSARTSSSTTSITLKNVVVSVALDPSIDAGKATSAMMAPPNGAAFKRKQGLVVWKMPELVVSDGQQKFLVRFATTGPKARPGHVEAKWELQGTTGSRLGVSVLDGAGEAKETADPFSDDGMGPSTPARMWNEVHTSRRLTSGRYSAA